MEDLRSAARAEKARQEREQIARQQYEEEQEERRREAERVSQERARQFVEIVQSKNIDPIGEYDEVNPRGRYGIASGLANGPRRLGWVAVHERLLGSGDGESFYDPAIFVTPSAEIYSCKRGAFEGTQYVTELSSAPEGLAGDEKWQGMARRLAQLEVVD